MSFHQMIICVVFSVSVLSVLSSGQSKNSSQCDRSCGGVKNRVPYPFGFSNGCEIKLDCTHGKIQIGDFRVENVTSDNLMVNLPANCNRSIEQLAQLFGPNYAPTWRNGLLLQNCSSSVKDCVIPNILVKSRFARTDGCSSPLETINCYADGDAKFLDYDKVRRTGNCSVLFSSIAADSNENDDSGSGGANGSSTMELNFQEMELGWWLEGYCGNGRSRHCHHNASCTEVIHGNRTGLLRCKCNPGYSGDGFTDGKGCRKVSGCNPSKYMSGKCGGTRASILIGGIVAGALLVPAIKNMTVELNAVHVTHALITLGELTIKCAEHYSWYAMRSIYIAKGSPLLPPSFTSIFDDLASSSLDVFFDPLSRLPNLPGITIGTLKLISKIINDKGFSGTKRYFGDLGNTVKTEGSNILFAAVTEISDSVLKGAVANGFQGMATGFLHGILKLAMEPSLLSSAFIEGGPDREIKLDRSPGIDELYIEGYLQGMLDAIYKQEYLRVRVIEDQVILKNLPPNSALMEEITERVKSFLESQALLKGQSSKVSRSL